MKKLLTICVVVGLILTVGGVAQADAGTATWDVATVHGLDQFSISGGGSSLHYNQQGWTEYVWDNNNGTPPGTIATTTVGPNSPSVDNRSGMRTFATTDVAVGQKLSDLKLVFDYKHSLGGSTTINFFMTDGAGKFGIFAPTSKGMASVGVTTVIDANWTTMTIDLTKRLSMVKVWH